MKATHAYTAIIEQDTETDFYVAHVPDLAGAHTQAETLEESPNQTPESHFIGTQLVTV